MKRYLLALFNLTVTILCGQEYYFRQAPVIQDSDLQQISILFQASDQMVWIGTEIGIYAFDGREYYPVPRPDGISKKVTAISDGPQEQIWAGYEDGYLHKLTLHGFNRAVSTEPLRDATISKILFHPDGEVYITTYGKGIWIIQEEKLSRLEIQPLHALDDIYDAILDQEGTIWLATDDGIWTYHKGQGGIVSHKGRNKGLPDEIVTRLIPATGGDVWIGLYDHGLARYYFDKDTILSVSSLLPTSGHVVDMASGNKGSVWLGTQKSIITSSLSGQAHAIRLPPEIPERLECLLFDRTGNLWLASGNKLFVASTQLEYITPGISGIQAVAIAHNQLWLGCEIGLYSLDLMTQEITPHLLKEKINILSIYTDPSGMLWIGTFGQGLYIFNPVTHRFRHLTENHNLSNNSILNIDGKENKVWLATLGGITEVHWQSNPMHDLLDIIKFQNKYKFPAGYVYDVHVADNGTVWFGTDGNGLFYLDQDEFRPFVFRPGDVTEDILAIKTIYSVATDPDQNIWISGSKGQIVQMNAQGKLLELFQTSQGAVTTLITSGTGEIVMIHEGAIEIRHPEGDMYVFNETSGLKSFSPNINATVKDANGSIWIADTDRILHYVPEASSMTRHVAIYLEAVSPGTFHSMDPVKLRPDSNFLDLRFTGLWYHDPGSVQYRYMLEGHDQDWIYTREGRAVYSRLSPGTYTFIVAGSYDEDFTGQQGLRKVIIVLPPFYMRWWFILGATFLASWLAFTYIMGRIKRLNTLHKLEKEKTSHQLHAIQAQVNPHFLFNSFNTLSSIIEEDQEAAVDYVDQLSGFFRGVLMYRDAELIPLKEEMAIVRNYLYILQKRYGDNLRIIEDIRQLSGRIAPLSIQLLVENAIKHNTVSAEKPLTVLITIDDRWVTVSNPLQPKIHLSSESTGFGLTSLQTRYQYLTPHKIEIIKEQNTFTIKIPILHAEIPL